MQLESLSGSVLDQKYRIVRQLGKGAMGAVFQATHLGTTRSVAVKLIVPRLAGQAEFVQRFKREAEAAGRLRHPNVINVTDFGVTRVDGGDLAYLVMEYLDGQTLSSYLKYDPRPSFNFLLDVVEQTALALDAAHAVGIVHRDLKPSNIWLEPSPRGGYNVKVLDFGIAKVSGKADVVHRAAARAVEAETLVMTQAELETAVAEPDAPLSGLMTTPSSLMTTVGTLLGTPAYMAPEQCQGLPVDGRADIYSLAVIAYEMLCSRLPFPAEDVKQLVEMQIRATPESPHQRDSSVPAALAEIVMSGLDKDPTRRPPSAGAFAARLRGVAEGELAVIRKSRDVFITHTNSFMPLLLACMSPMLLAVILVRFAAHKVFEAKLASLSLLIPAIYAVSLALVWFGLQLFKAGCMMLLEKASETGQFRPSLPSVISALAHGIPSFLRTQFRSLADLRPRSFPQNVLWPVVWAREKRTGRDAIDRSRELYSALPGPCTALAVRQLVPPLLGVLLFPTLILLFGAPVAALRVMFEEAVAGSPLGWMLLLYPLLPAVLYLHYGSTFSFLYWSALRCRNEGTEIALPAATREGSRNKYSASLRPVTLILICLPVLMLAVIVIKIASGDNAAAMQDALEEGRTTAVLGYLNAGMPVDRPMPGKETPLMGAVGQGQRDLVEALLARGANVNARSRDGSTPLWLAAQYGRADMARLLVDHGAAVDGVNNERRTALMAAAMRGNEALVQLLLEHGAKPGLTDSRGKTAMAYAQEEGHGAIVKLLESR